MNGRRLLVSLLACLGLVVLGLSVGGGAYAAHKIGKNLVVSKSIKNGAVTAAKLAAGSVDGSKVKDGSLGAADLAPGTIPAPGNGKSVELAGCTCLPTAPNATALLTAIGVTPPGFGFLTPIALELADFGAFATVQGVGQSVAFSVLVTPVGASTQELALCTIPSGSRSCKASTPVQVPADSAILFQARAGAGGSVGGTGELGYTLRVL